MRVINLTVVQDGNPDMLDAIICAEKLIAEGKVRSYSVTASMAEDNLNVEVYENYDREVKDAFIALKYMVV